MFLTEDFPCLFKRTMESRPRSNVEYFVPVSEFLADEAVAFFTIIELHLWYFGCVPPQTQVFNAMEHSIENARRSGRQLS